MKIRKFALSLSLAMAVATPLATLLSPATAHAQNTPTATAKQTWAYKTHQLTRDEVDALLTQPQKVLFIDVRRPDEVSKLGSFPVILNVQIKSLEQYLDFIPRDRTIVTVSNRAHRAGEAGDVLSAHGFKVAGAIGTEDYREAGGTLTKIAVPAQPIAQKQ